MMILMIFMLSTTKRTSCQGMNFLQNMVLLEGRVVKLHNEYGGIFLRFFMLFRY